MRHKLVSLLYIKVLSLSLAIFFLSAVHAQQSQFDFRKTSWGMTKDQVKASESSKFDVSPKIYPGMVMDQFGPRLLFTSTVLNKNVELWYIFLDHKLVRAGYSFETKHTNQNEYINDYEDIKGALIQKYSTPTRDLTIWSNVLYKFLNFVFNDRSDWGRAVSIGNLMLFSIWETDTTIIKLALSGDNHELKLRAAYYSKQLLPLVEKAKQEKIQSDIDERI